MKSPICSVIETIVLFKALLVPISSDLRGSTCSICLLGFAVNTRTLLFLKGSKSRNSLNNFRGLGLFLEEIVLFYLSIYEQLDIFLIILTCVGLSPKRDTNYWPSIIFPFQICKSHNTFLFFCRFKNVCIHWLNLFGGLPI